MTDVLCRDCAHQFTAKVAPARCRECGSPRLIAHRELTQLTLAHIDCDAFYATVEKRDNPALIDKPVIVGGGKRGVVAAACYLARMHGVRSAMPMFEARKRCPKAVVVRPDMKKYAKAGQAVRRLMRDTTPLVEPLSIDEAFLDLSGTERLHHGSAARTLVLLINRIETEVGISASVGLSHNKFLAKVASDLDKPRGFSVIGRAETRNFLDPKPVGIIWGVGKALRTRLHQDGIETLADLRRHDEITLMARYGSIGRRLFDFSHGRDARAVIAVQPVKSVSAETTFDVDMAARDDLKRVLWKLAEEVSRRMKSKSVRAGTVTLKLKTARFKLLSRSRALPATTDVAEHLYDMALALLEKELPKGPFRLIGIGGTHLAGSAAGDPENLLDPAWAKDRHIDQAMDNLRGKFGEAAIIKGRSLKD